jgi:myo-inositol catabolism protein IolH
MTLSLATDLFRHQDRHEAFVMIREAGYRFVELKGQGRTGPYMPVGGEKTEESLKQLKGELADAGLTPIAAFIVYGIGSSNEKKRREAIARWRQAIDAVGRLGLGLITTELTGDREHPQEGQSSLRKSLDELLPQFEAAGIHVSAAPHTPDVFAGAMPAIELIRGYGSRHLGYLHVVPHAWFLGKSMRELILEARGILTHVQVADTFRPERIMVRGTPIAPHLHLIPGLGDIDFRETFDALQEIDYHGYVSGHLISHQDQPKEAAIKSREYLQKLLGGRARVG